MNIFKQKEVTVRTVRKSDDGKWYVFRQDFFGRWQIESYSFSHATSAWAHLGKLVAREMADDE